MADEKRSKLMELANRKRQEAEEAAERERQAKAPAGEAIDFGDESEDEEAPAAAPEDASRAAAVDFGDEELEGIQGPTAADRAFIDDEGVAPEERIDFGDEPEEGAGGLTFDEAEEALEDDMEDEFDKIFGKRRRHETGEDAETRATVENLLSQMEVAVEADIRACEAGKPAVSKLRLLGRVQEILSIKKLHNDLLDNGLLGVLKSWIEPMPNVGTLPNSKVRSAVLTLLTRLPVDCAFEDRREQLKQSGLGKVVMFLSKLPEETPANRRTARELVEKWSRPILAPRGGPAVDEEEMQRILLARQQRQRAQQAAQDDVGAGGEELEDGVAVLRPGQPGYRFHASIPQAASLDYVKRPESRAVMVEKRAGGKVSGEHKLTKKLKTMKKPAGAGRAAHVSVQGRDVTLQH